MQERTYSLVINRLPEEKLIFKNYKHITKHDPSKKLMSLVDLRLSPNMPPIFDQGKLGSCAANALCSAYEFDAPDFNGSRLFLYYNERILENNISQDAGTTLSYGIQCLEKYGVCPEADWPYDVDNFAIKPRDKCYTDALNSRVVNVSNIKTTIKDMKRSLQTGIPFVIGIQIYSSFESKTVSDTGIVPMPSHTDTLLGGQAVMVCGYNDNSGRWIVRNSWGTSWGDKGYFYLPYAYLENSKLTSDAWHIQVVSLAPHIYNVPLSRPLEQDINYKTAVKLSVPTTVDFRVLYPSKMIPVYDQGKVGSCTANALCAAYSFVDSSDVFLGSRLFLYYNTRLRQGSKVNRVTKTIVEDSGSTLINSVKTLQIYGVCSESQWPYIVSRYAMRPPPPCYRNALSYRGTRHYSVQQDLSSIQSTISIGLPILLGFYVFDSFESKNSLITGYIPMPYRQVENVLGGHAVLLCGYDMTKTYPANPLNPTACPSGQGVWIIKNSWGTSAGDHGYFYLPLPYLLDRTITLEMWCLSAVSK